MDSGTLGKKSTPSSPKMNQRKRTGSDASSGIVVNGNGNGYESDLEALKQEILKEVRKELYKVKAEIIDGKYFHRNMCSFCLLIGRYIMHSTNIHNNTTIAAIKLELNRR